VINIKFLLVISMLCKTEWSWELGTWSHKMNLLDILSTSPSTSVGNEWGQQMRIQILILGFKGLIIDSWVFPLLFLCHPRTVDFICLTGLKARYRLSLRTDVSKKLYKRVCIHPRQVTSSFCRTAIVIVIVNDDVKLAGPEWIPDKNTIACIKISLACFQKLILGLHCHAMKNKNANHSIQKD